MSEMSEFIVYPSVLDTTPIGKVFKYYANGDLPRQFRIVQVAEDEFEIHQTICDPYIGFPKFLGGNGCVHYRCYWGGMVAIMMGAGWCSPLMMKHYTT